MRASHLISNVEFLATLGADAEATIRGRCAEEIREIDESVRVAWLPLEIDVRLSQAVLDVCGAETFNRWGRDAIAASARGPLLGPILGALRRTGMLTPSKVLGRAPVAWNPVYRNCGSLHWEPDEATLRLDGAPASMCTEPYLLGIAAAFEGALEIAGQPDANTELQPRLGTVRFVFHW